MTHYPIIGIAGRARTGKDTVAEAILSIGAARYQYRMAGPIKTMLRVGLGIDADSDGDDKDRIAHAHLGKTTRELLQTLGTEWGRNMVHPDIWVIEAQQAFMVDGPGMVISDIRFANEAYWVRQTGGKVIHIQRHGAPIVNSHASENGVQFVAGVDWIIDNDGTLADLRAAVSVLFRSAT